MKSTTFVFFGIVGSGKGTQVKLLIDVLKNQNKEVVYAYPGNEYRKIIEGNNQTSFLVKETINQGKLQPDFLTDAIFVNLLKDDISENKYLIADGYPRTIQQARIFEEVMTFYKRENITIIYLDLGEEEALKRMKLRAREDDTDEAIQKRFDEYKNKVVPAMEYFTDKDNYQILRINGEQSIEDVHRDIINLIKI
jgi:adenylate kinase